MLPARCQLNRYFDYQNIVLRCLNLVEDLASGILSSGGDTSSHEVN